MPKTSKSRPNNSSKFIYGAVIGVAVGTLAVLATPTIAVDILVGLVIVAAYVFILTRQRAASGKNWTPRMLSPAPVLGALVIGVMSVVGVQYLGMSLAWHPEGTIKKYVTNVTTGGQQSDANTAATAVSVKTGDIITYTIVIGNSAPAADQHYNDLDYIKLTDTLPAGVQLVSDPTKRTITEDLGTILPGKSITKTYQLKVISTTNATVIENKACFTANSVVKDNPQSGCDVAIIKTNIPPTPPPTPPTPTPPTPTPPTPTPPTPTPPTPTPPTPTPPTPTPPTPTPPTPTPPTPTPTPPTPTPTPPVSTTKELPNVGARSIVIVVIFAGITGYIFSAIYGTMRGSKSIRFR